MSAILVMLGFLIPTVNADDVDKYEEKISSFANDSIRIDSLNEWAYNFRNSKPQIALACADRAVELSVATGNRNGEKIAHYRLGLIKRIMGQPDSSVYHNRCVRNIARQMADTLFEIKSQNAIAKDYWMTGLYDSTLYYAYKALELSKQIGDSQQIARSNNRIAVAYELTGEFEKSIDIIKRNIEIYERLGDTLGLLISWGNLGNKYVNLENFEEAIKFYHKSIYLSEIGGYEEYVSLLTNNIGSCYFKLQNYEKALQNFQKSKELKDKFNQREDIDDLLLNIGLTYQKLGNQDLAISYLTKSLESSREINDLDGEFDARRELYQAYYNMGLWKKALDNHIEYEALEDSMFNLDKQKLISEYKSKYEVTEKEAENLKLENINLQTSMRLKNRTIERNTVIGAVMALVLLLAWYFTKVRKDKAIASQKFETLKREKELLAAKYLVEGQEDERKRVALELHDGIGVLLSTAKMQFTTFIKSQLEGETNKYADKAYKLIDEASTELRKVSYKMMPGILAHYGLVEAMDDLLIQVEDSSGMKANMSVNFEARLEETTEIMLYRIFQELINNTVKHSEANNIIVELSLDGKLLHVKYADDGKGFDPEDELRKKSNGLKNIGSRVQFLNGDYQLKSEPGNGMKITIEIPDVEFHQADKANI